jgi:hypothetical protein
MQYDNQLGDYADDKGVEKTNDSDSPKRNNGMDMRRRKPNEQKQSTLEGYFHTL